MWQNWQRLGAVVAAIFACCPLALSAEDTGPGRERITPSADRREEPIRIQVSVNLFFPGPSGDGDEAMKSRERARRAVYELAAGECSLVADVLAKTCRLESVSVNINRQPTGQTEGYMAGGNFVLRATLK